ncbi:hypothetical protein C7388_105200 [Methylobacterium radiotolerans]|jgi:hypothetical protein|nr:hypothetical protein C7388_105200 [Methylobacterium organophilum]
MRIRAAEAKVAGLREALAKAEASAAAAEKRLRRQQLSVVVVRERAVGRLGSMATLVHARSSGKTRVARRAEEGPFRQIVAIKEALDNLLVVQMLSPVPRAGSPERQDDLRGRGQVHPCPDQFEGCCRISGLAGIREGRIRGVDRAAQPLPADDVRGGALGTKPSEATSAVIATGRSRVRAPSDIASSAAGLRRSVVSCSHQVVGHGHAREGDERDRRASTAQGRLRREGGLSVIILVPALVVALDVRVASWLPLRDTEGTRPT